jgi:hypothetical protein
MSAMSEIDLVVDGAEPLLVDAQFDNNTTVRMLRRDERPLLNVLYELLDLSEGSRRTYMKARGWSLSSYKDSGEWSHHRDPDGNLRIVVDVGCWCSRDCCGHACALSHTISLVGGFVVVVTRTSYNY